MRLVVFSLAVSFAVVAASAATLPNASDLRGEYVEARTADVYTGPCFANSEVGITGTLAVMGWKIEKGAFQGVKLDGLSVVGVVRSNDTLGDPFAANVSKSVIIVDEKATLEQRIALQGFAQKMGGKLLADVVRVESRPIDLTLGENSIHSRRAKLVAGELAKIETRPLDGGDQICHNEQVWYKPLTATEHAMPAYTLANGYKGEGLGTQWNYPGQRSSFVASFHYQD